MTGPYDTSETQGRAPRAVQRVSIAALVLAAAAALAVLAWPRLIAGVAEAPFEGALLSLSGPVPASDSIVRRIVAAKERAAGVHATAKTLADIGLLDLREAMRLGPLTPEGKAALEASVIAHRRSLALDASNAYVWTRLAQGSLVRDGAAAADRLAAILPSAVDAAPYDAELVIARVDVALAAWDRLPDSVRSLMVRQIHIAADQSPTLLADIAQRRLALARLLDVLSDDPRLLKRFALAYSRP